MKEYYVPEAIDKHDIKRLRNKLSMTQSEFAKLVNVSKKTVERWESTNKEITGPITTLVQVLLNSPRVLEQFVMPVQTYPLRLKYFFRKQLCTIIDVDEQNRHVVIHNYQNELIYRAFGKIQNPSYEDYEDFLASRCIPKERDKMKIQLRELDIPFYDPMLIIEKTKGRMAEDEFWIDIEYNTEGLNI